LRIRLIITNFLFYTGNDVEALKQEMYDYIARVSEKETPRRKETSKRKEISKQKKTSKPKETSSQKKTHKKKPSKKSAVDRALEAEIFNDSEESDDDVPPLPPPLSLPLLMASSPSTVYNSVSSTRGSTTIAHATETTMYTSARDRSAISTRGSTTIAHTTETTTYTSARDRSAITSTTTTTATSYAASPRMTQAFDNTGGSGGTGFQQQYYDNSFYYGR